ncbi:ATP-dependent RNA helicase DeaD [Lutibacter agarilyticus]|uniref:DEAD-box ATP-dependent RNA helicase RhpA n=1 Tax=Lutibacter agarilyticus TaxID=1109740 RepID=A0A238VEV7_9FLAO|nr:DEAD/DEAH box helicase [Lutibacter agarilyticus]SNR32059.1 ATP-dependent RNA helicase DeaD [Lutibacter agarilyticus]
MTTFKDLGLNENIIKALTDLGYENPTEIQEKAIPQVIASKEDLKAFAQTGTGKTAAFSLPILEQIDINSNNTQAIILSPTRELALQIAKNIEDFAKHFKGFRVAAVYGGANIEEQIRKLKKGAHIVVGTPGRTVDLINRRQLKLANIEWLVLDEADEMLNMGFKDELDKILEVTPNTKQTLLFSATFPREVESIAKNYMTKPVEITSGQKNKGSDQVSHQYYVVSERNRYNALKRIADVNPDIYSIIFCRTRRETQEVADKLIKDGYNADALHGDLSQAQRDSVMGKFRKKHLQILVATDVAARGLDVTDLTHVINHKLPDQIESYTHRSGRTGRAGKEGISIAIVTAREKGKLRPIERIIGKQFVSTPVPTGKEICQNQLLKLIDKVHDIEINETEINDFLPSIYEKLEGLDREELIKRFVSLEFNTFLSYYENAPDLNDSDQMRRSSDRDSRGKSRDDENMSRFFINIGRKDKLNPARLIGLINDQDIAKNIEIGQIEILDTFSFFELDKNYTEETISAFQKGDVDFEGRNVNVEKTEKKRSGRGGGGGRRDRGDRKDGGGDRNSRSGGGRSRSKDRKSGGDFSAGFGRKRSDSKSDFGGSKPSRRRKG